MVKNWGVLKFAMHEYVASIEEMKHVEPSMDRILMLAGQHDLQDLGKLLIGEDAGGSAALRPAGRDEQRELRTTDATQAAPPPPKSRLAARPRHTDSTPAAPHVGKSAPWHIDPSVRLVNTNGSYYDIAMPVSNPLAAPPVISAPAAPTAPSMLDDGDLPRWPSQVLLAGGREAAIQHAGAVYRLRLTALGKLILTK